MYELETESILNKIEVLKKSSYEDDSTDFHLHSFNEIFIYVRGDVNVFYKDNVSPLYEGDIALFGPTDIHKIVRINDGLYERYIVYFDPEIFTFLNEDKAALSDLFNKKHYKPLSPDSKKRKELFDLLERMNDISHSSDALKETRLLSSFFELMLIINDIGQVSYEPEDHQDAFSATLKNIIQYINENYYHEISLDQLAEEFNISKYYLTRLFKKHTGSNLYQFIIYKRISYAKLLLEANHNVTEVCYMTGFKDYSNFIKQFKKVVGIPPGKYKSGVRSSINANREKGL